MKKIETFISEDGIIFDNAKTCVEHEFKTIDGLVDKINKKVDKKSGSDQLRWCESGACACMGCINYEFRELGLTKEHWEVWLESYRQPRIDDEPEFGANTKFSLHLKEGEIPKLNLIKALKEHYFRDLNFVQIGKKIEASMTKDEPLYESDWYSGIISLKEKIEEFGVKSIVKRNGRTLEEIKEQQKMKVR
jgi:hypothetical protein